jgi:hypothetical protein
MRLLERQSGSPNMYRLQHPYKTRAVLLSTVLYQQREHSMKKATRMRGEWMCLTTDYYGISIANTAELSLLHLNSSRRCTRPIIVCEPLYEAYQYTRSYTTNQSIARYGFARPSVRHPRDDLCFQGTKVGTTRSSDCSTSSFSSGTEHICVKHSTKKAPRLPPLMFYSHPLLLLLLLAKRFIHIHTPRIVGCTWVHEYYSNEKIL